MPIPKEIYNFYILGRIDTKAVRLDGTPVFELDSNQEDEFDRLAKQLPWWEEYKKKQLKKEKDIKESEEKPNEE